jgi:hypothetical protein
MATHMTPKARMMAALRGEKPDVLPAAPCYLTLYLADYERGFYMEQYRRLMRGQTRRHIDHAEDTHIRAEALYASYGIFKERPDWIDVRPGPTRSWAERTDMVCEDETLYYEDRASGRRVPLDLIRLPEGDEGGSPTASQDVWDGSERFAGPDDVDREVPVRAAGELLNTGAYDLPRRVLADYGDRYFMCFIMGTPYLQWYYTLGYQGLMCIQRERPGLFHYMLQRRLAQEVEVVKAWATVGIHGIYAEEAFTAADSISARNYREFVQAYNRPFFEQMSQSSLLVVYQVCGDVLPRIEDILGCGADAVSFEESKKNWRTDFAEIVSCVAGRQTLFGNIDSIRFGLNGTMDEMAAEVSRQASFRGRARGFVAGIGSPFPLETNPRQVDMLVHTAHSIPA